jgi:hypothetical protein
MLGKASVIMIADLAMQRALDRLGSAGFERLSDEDKTLATIWFFESRVANGGFAHFFKSAEGYLAPHAPAAFRAVGADTLADIAAEANACLLYTSDAADELDGVVLGGGRVS